LFESLLLLNTVLSMRHRIAASLRANPSRSVMSLQHSLLSVARPRAKSVLLFFGVGAVIVLIVLLRVFGWVRVEGQIGKYFWSPLLDFPLGPRALYRMYLMPRFGEVPLDRMEVFVVSLPRLDDRRKYMQDQLEGSNYSLVDAIDGNSYDFSRDQDVHTYMGRHRLSAAGLDSSDCVERGVNCPFDYRVARLQMALDLTYIKLFRHIANDPNVDVAVILEDDAAVPVPAKEFKPKVASVLALLPRNWHLLLMFTFEGSSWFGPEVEPGIRVLRTGVGTAAFAIKKETAKYILDVGKWLFPSLVIDLLMCGFLVETSRINGYVTYPLLVGHGVFVSAKDPSILDPDAGGVTPSPA
jgi:hypothetical protein